MTPSPADPPRPPETGPARAGGGATDLLRLGNPTLYLLFERSTDPILLLDPSERRLLDANPAALRLLNCPDRSCLPDLRPSEWPAHPPIQSPAPGSPAEPDTEGHRFEWLARCRNGTEVPLEVVATPIRIGGRSLHVMVARDISQRKRAEAALRESQALLASIADNISQAIYRSDARHRLIFVNRAYLVMFGYASLEELQAVPREVLYADPAARPPLLALLRRDDAFSQQEVEYVRKDGTRFWGLASARIVRDPRTGTVDYHVGAIADITERRRAAEEIRHLNATLERRISERTAELAASEAQLRTLVEHAPEAIVVYDAADGRFMSCNQNAVRLFGLTRDQLCSLTPIDVSPLTQPDGRPSAEAALECIEAALAGGTPVFEWTHRHASGRLVPCEVRLVRLPVEGRNLLRASITDNSERHRRELIQMATYQISEAVHTADDLDSLYQHIHQTVRGLMPAANFYIALADPHTGMIEFPYYQDEYDRSQAPRPLDTGLTSAVLRTGQSLLVDAAMTARKRRVGDAVTFEGLEHIRYLESGHPAANWLGVPLKLQGRTVGVMAVQDYHNPQAYGEEAKQILTFVASQTALAIERKRSEQALRDSEAKFRALFEASSQGVMLHDAERYLEVNPATVRIMGYDSADDFIGRHPRDTSPPFQPDGRPSDLAARDYIRQCMDQGSVRFDWVARSGRGQDIPLEVLLTRIEMGGRQLIQAVIHDISERKRAENELRRALQREKELGQMKSTFVSMVSHEFRTPLGVIMSSAGILERYFDRLDPAERLEHLDSIQRSTRRMGDLMEEVLLLSRLDAGRVGCEPVPLDLAVLLRTLTDEVLSVTVQRCPILLDLRLPDTPAIADESLLRHVFSNLLSNAVKYSDPGSPVEFTARAEGEEAVCQVLDRGIGIPEADREWLFQAFHRGRNVGQRSGTGLGLVIVRRCLELHHGRIEVGDRPGGGTAVTVRLPLYANPVPP